MNLKKTGAKKLTDIIIKSDWEILSDWGTNLAKKKGLTKQDSREIINDVRRK